MNIKRNWAGVISCFLLFIVVCMSLAFNVKGAFRASGHPELGLLFFTLPGAAASFLPPGGSGETVTGRNTCSAAVSAADAVTVYFNAKFLAGAGVVAEWRLLVRTGSAMLFVCSQHVGPAQTAQIKTPSG